MSLFLSLNPAQNETDGLRGLALRWGTRKGDSLLGTLFGTGYWNYSHFINGKAGFCFLSIGLTGRGHLRWLALGRDF